MKRTPLGASVLAALLAAVSLSACSVSFGDSKMDADKMEKSGKSFLKGKLGDEKFDDVSCPDDEEAKEGNEFTCDFKGSDGTTGTLNIEVTSEDGDANLTVGSVKYTSDYVEQWITGDFADEHPELDGVLASVECPDDIPSKAGDTVACELVDSDGEKADLTVTVGDELDLEWDFDEVLGS